MAFPLNDNVYTQIFTPKEYQVELLEAAKAKNTIICSSSSATKIFVVVKLLQEMAWKLGCKQGKRALFILDAQNVKVMKSHIELLTDIDVLTIEEVDIIEKPWEDHILECSVIVTSIEICSDILFSNKLDVSDLNLIVIDDCLYGNKQLKLSVLMDRYREIDDAKPRIVGLAPGVLDADIQPECLENELMRLENLLSCSINTSSELVTLLRLCCHPRERIVECALVSALPLQVQLEEIILNALRFLGDHRFDPSEIYSDEFLEELLQAPDPKQEPIKLMHCFLNILRDLGAWAADQAALSLLTLIEKLKIKVAFERHYLLLCMLSTVLVHIRAKCDSEFQGLSDLELIKTYSTPKLLRFLEILKEFRPAGEKPVIEEEVEKISNTVVQKTGRGRIPRGTKRPYVARIHQEDSLCALVFVYNRFTAKVLYNLLYIMYKNDETYWWVSPLYSVEKISDPSKDTCEAEVEHRRQEDVLRKFRMHNCNVMIATSVLENGCDLPKCNLVIHFDSPVTFHSYVQSKARARASDAHYVIMVTEDQLDNFIDQLAEYMEVERTLLRYCQSVEPNEQEELEAEFYSVNGPVYKPSSECNSPCLNLSNAIAFINRYCAKLPSDTFTRLTPIWNVSTTQRGFVCNLRLPINSPLKYEVTGASSINALLACRMAAFKTCQLLHQGNELDDNLLPITKENFFASEDDWNDLSLEPDDEALAQTNCEPRPGTTKRRQYYYKCVADAFTQCLPTPGVPTFFYKIVMTLSCPLPEEQNTRGRRIHSPEESIEGFGILTSKVIPKICAFPIFTRCGEVCVDLELCSDALVMNANQILKITEFVNYTFNAVLRLQRYLMLFDPMASENCFLIVPTTENANGTTEVDWEFVDLIYQRREVVPEIIPDEERVNYKFDATQYRDAVVTPWYRNQDQPQYFYVAEICTHLNPKSRFPGSDYSTFEEYYSSKYGMVIQDKEQYLLDVDHTSARLNFLTPRYVNRKGVALPTSSEATKRAKRENLEQKQILVPELCIVHPFSASLWRKAVCLPCIIYRINALLLADEIRTTVAREMGLGKIDLQNDFRWPDLNFGWSLADVLKKSREQSVTQIELIEDESTFYINDIIQELTITEIDADGKEIVTDDTETKDLVEIGTWSNDMANSECYNSGVSVRYGSPTSWLHAGYENFSDSEDTCSWDDISNCGGLRIEFTGDNTAEALEEDSLVSDESGLTQPDFWQTVGDYENSEELKAKFVAACHSNKGYLRSSNVLVSKDEKFDRYMNQCQGVPLDTVSSDHCNADVYLPVNQSESTQAISEMPKRPNNKNNADSTFNFSFDEQPDLIGHPGPNPSLILQALTMSNANDGINLERLETIGDSFLKYAITNYLYIKYENVHEGKLSHLRSKQVSNLNLYRLGRRKNLGEIMIASKFDPHDNWLPPCYHVPKELEEALIDACVPANYWTPADVAATRDMTIEEVCQMVRERGEALNMPNMLPYNLVSQHSIPDKSIADCVEALIGAYLISCGPRGALVFMAWLGIRVLPMNQDGSFSELKCVSSPLLRNVAHPEAELEILLYGYSKFEDSIGYHFTDRAYLLQALTHASYSPNALTDCYQRLEFLGDAVLDYLITRYLYEDKRMHSPGALTDLRSALVNNTIFASLAVRHGFHRYFRHLSPGLHEVVERFVRIQEENGHTLVEELYLLAEQECEEVEDVEVPKALGDVFESVAGAIFLDSGMSLDAVWEVYYRMMGNEIERFSNQVPKSPIRELLELEPETAKFGRPEKLADGRRVRVTVEIFGKGIFKGIGRNYRIAKCTAAKCALKYLKRRSLHQHS